MSDNIPFEIQMEIMKRFPVKSLLQFRSVSKTWKSLIDSSDFIKHYAGQQHLLVYYEHANKYVSIVDDDTFPHQKVSVTIPVNRFDDYVIIGCSHGLLCLYNAYSSRKHKVVIWNISVRKAVEIDVPDWEVGKNRVVGFGVSRDTNDPKIVRIVNSGCREGMTSVPWRVGVFTLSTGAWRRPYGNSFPHKSIAFLFSWKGVAVDGVIYWLVYRFNGDGDFTGNTLIISFDLTSEEFIEVNLPDRILLEILCECELVLSHIGWGMKTRLVYKRKPNWKE